MDDNQMVDTKMDERLKKIDKFTRKEAESGSHPQQIATRLVENFPKISAVELAVALKGVLPGSASQPDYSGEASVGKASAATAFAAMSAAAADSGFASGNTTVNDAIYLATLLIAARPDITPLDVAVALKDPRVYPNLTALQMGQVLKSGEVFPQITAAEMTQALTGAGYSQADADLAVTQLFPPQRQYRQEGPVGPTYNVFDDTQAAKNLSQPITKIVVRSGDIIDQVQAFYGAGRTPLPPHGGQGGGPNEVNLDSGDFLTEVSGFYGPWFGRPYILQLTFRTRNGKSYGPFGTMNYSSSRTPFSFRANNNEQIIAFLGSIVPGLEAGGGYSEYMTSLGVTIQAG
jgi:hypothetical protein